MSKPIQIVMTPTRNEAWMIRAFLECNGLWADYIIIADQMSTDGTREIIAEYVRPNDGMSRDESLNESHELNDGSHRAEVIMIDNTNPEFNEAERQAMLVEKAREVAAGRDTLLWGLDADEILPANWQDTEDGKHILNSVKGDVFCFKWAQIAPDKKHYGDSAYFPWLFHDDGVEPHGNHVRKIHSMRIPYPQEEKQVYYVKDFRVLHYGGVDLMRVAAKCRFYLFVDWENNHGSMVQLSRLYYKHRIENIEPEMTYTIDEVSVAFQQDLWSLIEIGSVSTWCDDYIFERLSKYPVKQLRELDIWDEDFLKNYKIEDPRRWIDKVVHTYLHKTQKHRNLIIRGIDKLLKIVY